MDQKTVNLMPTNRNGWTCSISLEKPRHRRALSFDGSKYCQLDANKQEWLDLLHQRPKIEDQLKMTGWMDKGIKSSEEQKVMLRGPPANVLEALDSARFAENPHPTDERVTDVAIAADCTNC